MNKKILWSIKQNKPSLIVEDIVTKYPNVDPCFIYLTLLKRGIFKWLAVRQQLIRIKEEWKEEIKKLQYRKPVRKRGYLEALEKCRAEIRRILKTDRWQVPDNDSRAKTFLRMAEHDLEGQINSLYL